MDPGCPFDSPLLFRNQLKTIYSDDFKLLEQQLGTFYGSLPSALFIRIDSSPHMVFAHANGIELCYPTDKLLSSNKLRASLILNEKTIVQRSDNFKQYFAQTNNGEDVDRQNGLYEKAHFSEDLPSEGIMAPKIGFLWMRLSKEPKSLFPGRDGYPQFLMGNEMRQFFMQRYGIVLMVCADCIQNGREETNIISEQIPVVAHAHSRYKKKLSFLQFSLPSENPVSWSIQRHVHEGEPPFGVLQFTTAQLPVLAGKK